VGLVDTLNGPGPFTVFAPTDAAFEKLPAGTLNRVLQNKERLTSILTHHVVSGKYMASDVKKLKSVKTFQGSSATAEVHRPFHRGVKIDDAQVI